MQAVETGGQAEVGAVVHDELDAWSEARPKFTRLVEHLPGVARFVAVLEQGAASGSEFFRGGEQSGVLTETGGIDDGIEARKHRSGALSRAISVNSEE
jgi:hypothetical protein